MICSFTVLGGGLPILTNGQVCKLATAGQPEGQPAEVYWPILLAYFILLLVTWLATLRFASTEWLSRGLWKGKRVLEGWLPSHQTRRDSSDHWGLSFATWTGSSRLYPQVLTMKDRVKHMIKHKCAGL